MRIFIFLMLVVLSSCAVKVPNHIVKSSKYEQDYKYCGTLTFSSIHVPDSDRIVSKNWVYSTPLITRIYVSTKYNYENKRTDR